MKIRQKIILYFSTVIIALIGIFFVFIYTLLREYRKEEFQQRLKDKTITTLRLLAEVREVDRDVLQAMDRFKINDLFQEKVLLFDDAKNLIYSGIDDTKILFSSYILERLSSENPWIETSEENFDVVGVYLPFQNKSYYGITKAYDAFGFSKLEYLKNVLLFTFVALSVIITLITFYLSRQISFPLNRMAVEINSIKSDPNSNITVPDTKDEINFLAKQFNDLMQRLNAAFAFQKHAIHHISHELKTPIAVLVSNFEKIENESDEGKMKSLIRVQKENTKNLGDIVNALLEISKAESGNRSAFTKIRIDDLIYDIIDELRALHPEYHFEVKISDRIKNESYLTPRGNKRLLRLTFMNLMINCVRYSNTSKGIIDIEISDQHIALKFTNNGNIINPQETRFLFQHFFRGENSKGKQGFGLGLVLASKIIQLHNGRIDYHSAENNVNTMCVTLPLDHRSPQ